MEMKSDNNTIEQDPLSSFSREHHHSLRFVWKIRKGLENGIELKRIKKYSDWFFENYLKPHFDGEAKYMFPILGEEHAMVKKSLARHRRLTRLFNATEEIEKSLHHIEEELDRHVRFEEQKLFDLIREKATEEEIERILKFYEETEFVENVADEFWEE